MSDVIPIDPKARSETASMAEVIEALQCKVHNVLCKLTCAHSVLWNSSVIEADEETGRAAQIVRECVRDIEMILEYDDESRLVP